MKTLEVIKMMTEYYGKEMTDMQVRVYHDTLSDLPVGLLHLAVMEIIKNGKPFMPRVAEIRSVARELRRASKFEIEDPLKLIPGAAQTEADLDERYGTIEEHRAICDVFTSGGSLSDRQRAILEVGARA